jgi:hypothetical protein
VDNRGVTLEYADKRKDPNTNNNSSAQQQQQFNRRDEKSTRTDWLCEAVRKKNYDFVFSFIFNSFLVFYSVDVITLLVVIFVSNAIPTEQSLPPMFPVLLVNHSAIR